MGSSRITGVFPSDDGSAAGGSEAMEKRAPLDGNYFLITN